ncbi:MAG: ATP-binding cassette domain-containing protein, partial [bacterium]
MPLIKLENVTKRYSLGETCITALSGVNLSIDHGEFVAVCGPSGSGKSTLCNIMGVIDSATSGSVVINDRD